MSDLTNVTDERGNVILEIFSEKQSAARTSIDIDFEEHLSSKSTPGGAKVPEHFDVGNFGHQYAEELIPNLPKGLDKEVTVKLPDGSSKRLDRVDKKRGIIYEVKPNTKGSIIAGEKQVKIYVEYMNREHPLGNGRKWKGKVVTYDKKKVIKLLKKIGWIETKHSKTSKKNKPDKSKGARKTGKTKGKIFSILAAAALHASTPKPASAAVPSNPAMTDNKATLNNRGADPSQRMVDTPNKTSVVHSIDDAHSRIVTKAPTSAPSAPPGVTTGKTNSSMPSIGTYTKDKVTVSYDLTNKTNKNAFNIKNIDISNFPKNDSKLVKFASSPYLRGAASAASILASLYIERPIFPLDIIKAHFSWVIREGHKNLKIAYPPTNVLLESSGIIEHEQTFEAVMDSMADVALDLKKIEGESKEKLSIINNLQGAFAYEDALISLAQLISSQYLVDLPAIYLDLNRRTEVLSRIANNLEDAFITIHTNVIGSIPVVYYESFTLWNVRTVFKELSTEMAGLTSAVNSRALEYERLLDYLNNKILKASERLDFWREFYIENEKMIKPKN